MQELTFDLSVPVSRLLLAGWSAFGAIQVASGAFSIERGDDVLGFAQIAFGLFFLLFVVLMPRVNRYVIAFDDSYLTMDKSLFRPRNVPWISITEIHIQLMKIEFTLENRKNITWNFNMSYTDNQIVKPQIIAALNEFAEAKGISVIDNTS